MFEEKSINIVLNIHIDISRLNILKHGKMYGRIIEMIQKVQWMYHKINVYATISQVFINIIVWISFQKKTIIKYRCVQFFTFLHNSHNSRCIWIIVQKGKLFAWYSFPSACQKLTKLHKLIDHIKINLGYVEILPNFLIYRLSDLSKWIDFFADFYSISLCNIATNLSFSTYFFSFFYYFDLKNNVKIVFI